ncbi:hypothetical protein D9757_005682 [Collybiopsis confluens]|uniref:Uncharacterized protein n=1 Tax=Collybiopsis confluens TaxID=2823264 RepID=A0A8H5HTB5_9AGAR|nr:hypothetical protein D9757_005682 [Collybiopsis confluens]
MPSTRLTRQNSIVELSHPGPSNTTTKRAKSKAKPTLKRPIVVQADVIEISDSEDESPRVLSAKRKSPNEIQLEQDVKKLKEESEAQKLEIEILRAAAISGPSNDRLVRLRPPAGDLVPPNIFSLLADIRSGGLCIVRSVYAEDVDSLHSGVWAHDWFDTIFNRHKAAHPQYHVNQQPYALAEAYPYLHHLRAGNPQPHYSCPTCREQVKNPPIEDFSLKKVVRAVAKAQGEGSPRKEEAGSSRRKGKSKVQAPTRRPDPWSKFFRSRT